MDLCICIYCELWYGIHNRGGMIQKLLQWWTTDQTRRGEMRQRSTQSCTSFELSTSWHLLSFFYVQHWGGLVNYGLTYVMYRVRMYENPLIDLASRLGRLWMMTPLMTQARAKTCYRGTIKRCLVVTFWLLCLHSCTPLLSSSSPDFLLDTNFFKPLCLKKAAPL